VIAVAYRLSRDRVYQFEFDAGLFRLGNPLRNTLIPTKIIGNAKSASIHESPLSARAAISKKISPLPNKTRPNIHAAIL